MAPLVAEQKHKGKPRGQEMLLTRAEKRCGDRLFLCRGVRSCTRLAAKGSAIGGCQRSERTHVYPAPKKNAANAEHVFVV